MARTTADPLVFYDVAELARECICEEMDRLSAELAERDPPISYGCPCATYVSAGQPAWDVCCDKCDGVERGQLNVWWENIFGSDGAFPSATTVIDPCTGFIFVGQMVVTVLRCIPTFEGQKKPADSKLDAAGRLLSLDEWAVIQALRCCFPFADSERKARRINITSVRPVHGPGGNGGCAGLEVRANVDLGAACACPEEPADG